jgi:hypothetical protein
MLARLNYTRDPEALFAHVEACWVQARGTKRFPSRKELNPKQLGAALPYVALVELVPGEPVDFRYRLIGNHIVVNSGQNLTGKTSLSLPSATPTVRPIYTSFLTCIKTSQPQCLQQPITNMNGTRRSLNWMIWPLSENGVSPDGLLCGAVFVDDPDA